jgi:hypothetical protein
MYHANIVAAGLRICALEGSATVTGLESSKHVIVPSSVFFPSLVAPARVAWIGPHSFADEQIKSITISRHVEVLRSSCFLYCGSLSSISFENDSRLRRIESNAFDGTALGSITIPRSVEILCSSCFAYCGSLSSISFENDSQLRRIESDAFFSTALESITIPQDVDFIDDSAFPNISNLSISIDARNSHFIVDSSRSKLIHQDLN